MSGARGISRLALVVLFAGVLFGPEPLFVAQKQLAAPEDASCLLNKLNQERETAGLTLLASHPDLVAIATRQAQRMAEAGELFHNPDGRSELPSGAAQYGENVAAAESCDQAHAGLMESVAHRENILGGQFTHVGIGEAEGPNGIVYVSQIFTFFRPQPASTPPPFQWRLAEPQPPAPLPPILVPAPAPPLPPLPAPPATFVESLAAPPPPQPLQIESKTRALSEFLEREEEAAV